MARRYTEDDQVEWIKSLYFELKDISTHLGWISIGGRCKYWVSPDTPFLYKIKCDKCGKEYEDEAETIFDLNELCGPCFDSIE